MTLTLSGPAPECYAVCKDGPAGEALYAVTIDLPRWTADRAKKAAASAHARLREAHARLVPQMREMHDAIDAGDEKARKRYDHLSRHLTLAETVISSIDAVVRNVPDDSMMSAHGGGAWIALERAVLAVEKLCLAAGMIEEAP